MSFLKKILGETPGKITCPRCMGKGHVNTEDIKRLGKELKWLPGTCAYCNSTGKVDPGRLEKLSFDTSYLTTDITGREAKKLQNGDAEALERAADYELASDRFILEVMDLFKSGVSVQQATDHYFTTYPNDPNADLKKKQLIDFLEKVNARFNMEK